jgi:hypothetical protein
LVLGNRNLLVPHFLIHSYAYYVEDNPIIGDGTFDLIVRLLGDDWDDIEHQHKHLIDRSLLKSGFYLQYPSRVVYATAALRSALQGVRASPKKGPRGSGSIKTTSA